MTGEVLIADAPATQAAATRPADDSLVEGSIHYTPPAGWTESKPSRAPGRAAYVSPPTPGASHEEREGATAIEVLPADAEINAHIGSAIIVQIRKMRKQAHQTVVLDPRTEPDKRFLLRIHEKYKVGDKTADVLRFYRQVGPRTIMVTVSSLAADPAQIKSILSAGEQLAMSATFRSPTSGKSRAKQ